MRANFAGVLQLAVDPEIFTGMKDKLALGRDPGAAAADQLCRLPCAFLVGSSIEIAPHFLGLEADHLALFVARRPGPTQKLFVQGEQFLDPLHPH